MHNSHVLQIVVAVMMALLAVVPTSAAQQGSFRAGAAKVDITPSIEQGIRLSGYSGRVEPANGIFDNLYVRAVVVDDGTTRAAVITGDVTSISNEFWEAMTTRIVAETGIAQDHILLAATHSHAAPSLSRIDPTQSDAQSVFQCAVADKILGALKQAIERLQPAVLGVGTGTANVNINRVARLEGGSYWLGKNPGGPSDKTVHVLRIATPDGAPIAVLVNYGVHCTTLSSENFSISGDIAGACSRYVEKELGDEAVALWTSGAGGDQAPLYNQQTTPKFVSAMGEILAIETLRVMDSLRMSADVPIQAAQCVVTCPGKRTVRERGYNREGVYESEDADPVDIRLSLILLDRVALAGVSGEVLTMIGQRLKAESPFNQTMMITHCNGSSGYLADDAAFEILSYETVSSRVKEGYADDAIVNGFLDMMEGM